ncbi:double zinc ribbon domain-containing protein [Yoonia sediminilitoris]|uniref:ComF family protein n=1 Tax=Yoonia sediminilitoris TaxID=1286148 RepID=A0A2T6KLR4_9RHOB|nr:double zinc ribbon domain-containing protein [Yoonia sediminilitoris]PUB17146.1 ComF family protein [Yoonia sediminilitoris]RCW97441.1 ComF family protein [Yoonia sediminilitoris]
MRLQSVIRAIYPAQCVACDAQTEAEFGLCGPCWRETQFIGGTICDTCGTPLPGDDDGDILQCDDCMTIARPWDRGRAALIYAGIGRTLVLRLKHSDRTELARPAALWMAKVARDLMRKDTILVPVPLHWTRLARRRYNQAALLVHALGREVGAPVCADALLRTRKTKPLEGHSRHARFEALADAIMPNPKRQSVIAGKPVLLIDDVMTSGATLAAGTTAALAAGASNVSIVTLARVVKSA